MHTQDFVVIADIIRSFPSPARKVLTEIFADRLGKVYPRFNKDLFRTRIYEDYSQKV